MCAFSCAYFLEKFIVKFGVSQKGVPTPLEKKQIFAGDAEPESAFRQVAVPRAHRAAAITAVWDDSAGELTFYKMHALPFGGIGASTALTGLQRP